MGIRTPFAAATWLLAISVAGTATAAYPAGEPPPGVARSQPSDPYREASNAYCTGGRTDAEAVYEVAWTLINTGRHEEAAAWMRAAADRGHGGAAVLLGRLPVPGAAPLCPGDPGDRLGEGAVPMPPAAIRQLADREARRHGLDPELVIAVIAVESGFDRTAVSPRNAAGLMQLIPETAARFGVSDVFDAVQNVAGGTRYLAWLLNLFDGDLSLALAGYNAGEGAVRRHRGVPPFPETIRYVAKVQHRYHRLLNIEPGR